jgi:hypothetical protein
MYGSHDILSVNSYHFSNSTQHMTLTHRDAQDVTSRLAEPVRKSALPNQLQFLAHQAFFNGMKQTFLETAVRVHAKGASSGRRSIIPLA